MACEDQKMIMHDYLDGQLSMEDEKNLSHHLQSCQKCQNHFHELSRTISLLQSGEKKNAPSNFTSSVMESLPEEKKQMRYRRWFNNHPYIVAVALLALFFMGSLFSGWGKGDQLVVSKQDDLIVEGDTVIVPKDIIVSGDLYIKNGNLKVKGQIERSEERRVGKDSRYERERYKGKRD